MGKITCTKTYCSLYMISDYESSMEMQSLQTTDCRRLNYRMDSYGYSDIPSCYLLFAGMSFDELFFTFIVVQIIGEMNSASSNMIHVHSSYHLVVYDLKDFCL